MEFPYVVKATQKSGKPDAFVWFTAKTEARANLMLDVALEDHVERIDMLPRRTQARGVHLAAACA